MGVSDRDLFYTILWLDSIAYTLTHNGVSQLLYAYHGVMNYSDIGADI